MKTPIRDRPSIDLSKSRGIDLNKPETGGFEAGSKPSQGAIELPKLGITGTRELGSIGGVTATADATVAVPLPTAVQLEINPVEQSVKAGVGFDLGALGLNVGASVQRTPAGVSVENVSFGVNVLGFGVSAEGKRSESSKIEFQIPGFEVGISSDKEGRTSVRLGFNIPGISGGVTFTPDDPGIQANQSSQVSQSRPGVGAKISEVIPLFKNNCLYYVIWFQHGRGTQTTFDQPLYKVGNNPDYALGTWTSTGNIIKRENLPVSHYSPGFIEWHDFPTKPTRAGYKINSSDGFAQIVGSGVQSPGVAVAEKTIITYANGASGYLYDYGNSIKDWINYWVTPGSAWDFSVIEISCTGSPNLPAKHLTPILVKTFPPIAGGLPNYPQNYKPMNCCDKVDEIYKYLGIGKFKSKKFKLSNAFLVPGGKGNIEIEDYYELTEALFRMLANGLIINPEASPNGTPWKVANASAWAAQMYEMAAESMSDGNSSQKVEIAVMMQLAQIMKVLAETVRKIEFLADATGYTPVVNTEEVPICFTIYEGHKGFGKKDKQVIDVSQAKTDEQVENTILKMLNPSKIPITKWEFDPNSISIKKTLDAM